MYPSVKEVIPGDDYVLHIVFDNGESGTLDMKQVLGFGVFQRLKDINAFRRVRVVFDTIEWDSGVDLDPEFVYSKCKGAKAAPQEHPADAEKAPCRRCPPSARDYQ
ncbi:MAG: DUF2442 domain-containing protein [Thermodesulfobacteriota bacterium]